MTFFIVQLSHPYMTTGKTIALTRWTFVHKVMSLLFNMLSRLVAAFLPRSKHILASLIAQLASLRPSLIVFSNPGGSGEQVGLWPPRETVVDVGQTHGSPAELSSAWCWSQSRMATQHNGPCPFQDGGLGLSHVLFTADRAGHTDPCVDSSPPGAAFKKPCLWNQGLQKLTVVTHVPRTLPSTYSSELLWTAK